MPELHHSLFDLRNGSPSLEQSRLEVSIHNSLSITATVPAALQSLLHPVGSVRSCV